MTVWKPSVRASASALGIVVGALAWAWARREARGVPLSPLHGGRRISPTWSERAGVRGERVPGETASLGEYARPGFDPDAVHLDVRALYERTGEFGMTVDAEWQFPYSLGAGVAGRWTDRIEQLNLPSPGGESKRVSSDLFALAEPAATTDPRDDPRLWVRTDDETGEGVFVAVYASHVEDGERLINIAVPLPGANLATVLRIDQYGEGVELTTDCPGGGLYLHTRAGAFRLPAGQRFRVSPTQEPRALDHAAYDAREESDVLAEQRISLLGLPLVTVRYAATREPETDD